ncbi:MAG: hypothetical protein GYA21_06140 [Myxococcales bacterium]|nr:hypothetical protein [Myxococcales bacterium]
MRAFIVLVAGLACLQTSALAVTLEGREPARAAAATDLAEIARVGGSGRTEFVLRGRVSRRHAAAAVRLAHELIEDTHRRFLPIDGSKLPPVDVCLFETTAEYRRFLREALGPENREGDLGVYWRYRRTVVANLSTPLGNLRHELAHALISDALGPLPAWLDEGLASLYNEAAWKNGAYVLGRSHRLAQLRAARAAGKLPDLAALAAAGEREVYGENFRAYYSLGRFIALYLDEKGKLAEFVQEMSQSRTTDEQRMALERYVDFAAFLAWTERL